MITRFFIKYGEESHLQQIIDVSDMPIFCLSYYGDEYIKEKDGQEKIVLDEEHLHVISDVIHYYVDC